MQICVITRTTCHGCGNIYFHRRIFSVFKARKCSKLLTQKPLYDQAAWAVFSHIGPLIWKVPQWVCVFISKICYGLRGMQTHRWLGPPGSTLSHWVRPRQSGNHFADDIFNFFCVCENGCIVIQTSLGIVFKGLVNNMPALVHINAWRWAGNKMSTDAHMSHQVSLKIVIPRCYRIVPCWLCKLKAIFQIDYS